MLPDLVRRLLATIRRAVAPPSTRADPRDLDALAATRDHRAVPDLLPLLVGPLDNDALRERVAATIALLLEHVSPSQLYWLDAEARGFHSVEFDDRAWFDLRPAAGPELCRSLYPHWPALGMLASHPNGYIRQHAVNALAHSTGGVEIAYLTIRANDWVDEIAETATSLLAARLVRANRAAVLAALPFIVRMLDLRRRDHRHLKNAFVGVLTSDDGRDVIEAIGAGDRAVSRALYALLLEHAPTRQIVEAALVDPDPVTRRRAVERFPAVAREGAPDDLSVRLATIARADRSPAVRRKALTLLADHDPEGARLLVRDAILDRAARIRSLARFLAGKLEPSLDVRSLYLAHLEAESSRLRVAAIEGLGEAGTRDDSDRLAALLTAEPPCIRFAALRALAQRDIDRALPRSTTAGKRRRRRNTCTRFACCSIRTDPGFAPRPPRS